MNLNGKLTISYGLSNALFDASKLALDETERFSLKEVPNMILVKFLLKDKESVLMDFFKKMHVKEENLKNALEHQLHPYLLGKKAKEIKADDEVYRLDLKRFNSRTFCKAAENSINLYNVIDENCFILAMLTETENELSNPYDKAFVDFLKELNIDPEVAECYFEGKLRKLEIIYSEIETDERIFS